MKEESPSALCVCPRRVIASGLNTVPSTFTETGHQAS